MFVLIIGSLASISAMSYYNSYLNNINNQVSADQTRLISDASARYIKDNYAAVVATAGPTTPAVITVPMLIATGYLGAGFTSTNPYGQTYQVLAREPVANQLESMVVTTGGMTIPELSIRRIAQLIGSNGGYISSTAPTLMQGSFGGWQTALSNFSIAPGAGHYASSLFFQNGQIVNDYLYRNSIPGHPELNVMNANIDMNGNIVTNANTVNAGTLNGTTVNGATVNGTNMVANTLSSSTINGTNAVISGRVTAADLVISSNSAEGTACAPNGRMSANASGAVLTCMSGLWIKQVAYNTGVVSTGQVCGNYAKGSIAFDASGKMFVCK
jgi:hypothetical protein